jgi:hypothetical protein
VIVGRTRRAPRTLAGEERARNDAIAAWFIDTTPTTWDDAPAHTVQITSFGGCGTTALVRHCADAGLDLPATPNHFPWKHQRVPPDPATVPSGFRVLYLHGDPRNAVMSVFRRGLQGGHYRALHMAHPPPAVLAALESLDDFLAAGVDHFGLEDHFDRWYARAGRYPVLFVRYEELASSWEAVAAFLGISPAHAPFRATRRSSDWRALPRAQRRRIDRLYGGLAARLAALPPVLAT